jgi:hypothetical protein
MLLCPLCVGMTKQEPPAFLLVAFFGRPNNPASLIVE